MTWSRVVGVLLLCLSVQTTGMAQGVLKTGMQSLPGALPDDGPKDPAIAYDFDLSKETFYVSVPKNYTGAQPFGLFIFISPGDDIGFVPADWADVLQQKKLIFIAPQKAGNERDTSRRAGLAIVAARKLMEMAKIDNKRIYVAGFSGGARVASYAAFLRPSLFTGVFSVCGVDFCRKVDRVKATREDAYGVSSVDEQRAGEAKKKIKFVMVTGSKDFRYGNILDIYSGGYLKDGYDAKLIDVPGMEHTLCPGKILSEGLVFLDRARSPSTGKN